MRGERMLRIVNRIARLSPGRRNDRVFALACLTNAAIDELPAPPRRRRRRRSRR